MRHELGWKVLVLMFGVLAAGSARAEERFALLVGANAGWSNDRPLRYAEQDAEHLREVLVELGGFAPDRVVLLSDPDTAAVRAQLQQLAGTLGRLGRDSLFIFYYSGHADERHLHLRGAPLSYTELRTALETLPATVRVGVLDACRSGSILATKGKRAAGGFSVDVVDELNARGLALLTSSGADELSQEARALAGSVFTHHLVSGLRGVADKDGDGRVVLSEAWRHAFLRTTADTASTALPHRPSWRLKLEGQGEPVLTRLARTTSQLLVPHGQGERYVVMDAQELRLVAEARAAPEGPMALALVPGHYRVKRVSGERLAVADVLLEPGQRVEVAGLAYTSQPLAGGLLKGRPDGGDEAAVHAWRRGEALRLLARGEPGAALALFEQLLAKQPQDGASLRGKARALVRLAEAYDRVGDRLGQRAALRKALEADPGLAEDPDLQSRREELRRLSPAAPGPGGTPMAQQKAPEAPSVLRWGVGLDLVGPSGMLALKGSLLGDLGQVHALVDMLGPGVGLSLRLTPWSSRWRPFIGGGGHLSLKAMGLPLGHDFPLLIQDKQFSSQQIWGRSLHSEVGVHYVSSLGPSYELSLGFVSFPREPGRRWGVVPMLGLGVGWYFRSAP
jgi:hypothetical protein